MTDRLLHRLFAIIDRRIAVIAGLVLITALAVGAVGASVRDDAEPSYDPEGQLYDVANRADEIFDSSATQRAATFLVDTEATTNTGDVLTRDRLLAVVEAIDRASQDPDNRAHLSKIYDQNLDLTIDGFASVATAVDAALPAGLVGATDDEAKVALAAVLAPDSPTSSLRFTLSQQATAEQGVIAGQPTTIWTSPAYQIELRYDLATFAVEDLDVAADTDEDAVQDARIVAGERWLRQVQDDLRADRSGLQDETSVRIIGVGIDPTVTAEEQFTAGGPFIFLSVGLIVVLVGVLLRSYWSSAIVATSLGAMLLLYNGVLGLLGIKMSSQLLLFVVPITLIAFGVDFFVHAAGRVAEARAHGEGPSVAYRSGMVAVLPALALAAATSIAAFLSNMASGIQAITQFGIAAAIGLGIAFVLLGWLAPRAVQSIEQCVGPPTDSSIPDVVRRVLTVLRFALVAAVAGAMVSLTALAPPIGIVGLLLFIAIFVAAPAAVGRRSRRRARADGRATKPVVTGADHGSATIGSAVRFVTRWRYATLGLFVVAGGVSLIGATRVESAFEVSDFFSSKTDFIVGLDRLDQHFSNAVGGPAYIYVEGDLTDPETILAMESSIASLGRSSADFARDQDGELIVTPNAAAIVRATMSVPGAAENASALTGVALADNDGDGLPDDRASVSAIYRSAGEQGVVASDGTVIFTPEQIESFLYIDGDTQATRLELLVTTFTDDAIILEARDALEAEASTLTSVAGESLLTVAVSGDVIAGQDSLAAFTRAMVVSLPIAVVVTVLIVGLAIRSIRYSAVTILPILLVVFGVWGYMWVRGFTINVVTATIAAIAVGVGIDFCTHLTVRFREELELDGNRFEAIRRAGEETGGALAISALTSIIGVGVMTAAPAPIFASFGELMAVMIFFSAILSLLALPCLLVLVTPAQSRVDVPVAPVSAHPPSARQQLSSSR